MVHEHIKKIPVRKKDSHKGDYGRVCVIAGSVGMTGAASLAALGAMRAGSGLVICGVPESLNSIMEITLTEVMTKPLPETKRQTLSLKGKESIIDLASKCDVVAMGPGLGDDKETRSLIRDLVREIEQPLVLDADGLNALAGCIEELSMRRFRTIITPHPGEMARLSGHTIEAVQSDRKATARSVAEITDSIVCLKGHQTVVANPAGDVYVNNTGNSGMATGGTGDVLTGMIASFVGQGIDDFSAAISAVYLHGLAGDIAAERKGPFSMIASDIIKCLPEAFKRAGII